MTMPTRGATTIKRTLAPLYQAERDARHAFHRGELGDRALASAYRAAEDAASTARWQLIQRFGEPAVLAVEDTLLPASVA